MPPSAPTIFRCDAALTPRGWLAPADLHVDRSGTLTAVTSEVAAAAQIHTVRGWVVPGLPNLHSHAFQRALAGHGEARTPASDDSFWTWREAMYTVALGLVPEQVAAIAAMAYVEMLEAGMTAVGEFHYLHHDRDGAAYADPAELSRRVLGAATATGIRMTLLPVLYRHSGLDGRRGKAAEPRQRRFVHTVDGFLRLHEVLTTAVARDPNLHLGWAPHSLRAVLADELLSVHEAIPRGPVHIHAAEQEAEVDAVTTALGLPPVQWLLDHGLDRRWCVVHATHVTPQECRALAASGAVAGLCPTTEASLGDGLFPAGAYLAADGAFGVGSDSQIRIDPAEELRLLEWGQRLHHRRRNLLASAAQPHVGRYLYEAAAAGGAQALDQPVGALVPGRAADFVALDPDHPRLVGHDPESLVDSWIFAAGPSAVQTVVVGGRVVVQDGTHTDRPAVVAAYRSALDQLQP